MIRIVLLLNAVSVLLEIISGLSLRDDTETIAGLLFDYHGNNNPEEIAKYLVRNNIGLKTR